MAKETDVVEKKIEVSEPIILNLGKQKRKRIKKLKEGRGKLWVEVQDVIDEVSTMLNDELEGKTIVPLILIYQKKPRRKQSRSMFGF